MLAVIHSILFFYRPAQSIYSSGIKVIEVDQEHLMLFLQALQTNHYLPISNAAVSLGRLAKTLKTFVTCHESDEKKKEQIPK